MACNLSERRPSLKSMHLSYTQCLGPPPGQTGCKLLGVLSGHTKSPPDFFNSLPPAISRVGKLWSSQTVHLLPALNSQVREAGTADPSPLALSPLQGCLSLHSAQHISGHIQLELNFGYPMPNCNNWSVGYLWCFCHFHSTPQSTQMIAATEPKLMVWTRLRAGNLVWVLGSVEFLLTSWVTSGKLLLCASFSSSEK